MLHFPQSGAPCLACSPTPSGRNRWVYPGAHLELLGLVKPWWGGSSPGGHEHHIPGQPLAPAPTGRVAQPPGACSLLPMAPCDGGVAHHIPASWHWTHTCYSVCGAAGAPVLCPGCPLALGWTWKLSMARVLHSAAGGVCACFVPLGGDMSPAPWCSHHLLVPVPAPSSPLPSASLAGA